MRKKYIRNILIIIFSVFLISGCSSDKPVNTGSPETQDGKESIVDSFKNDSVTIKLNSIHLYEWNEDGSVSKSWSLSDYSDSNLYPDTPYYVLFDCRLGNGEGYSDEGFFTAEKAKPIFEKFESISKEKYNPEHPNDDGLMVKEYYPNSIQAFYIPYDSEGKSIGDMADERYQQHKDELEGFYVVSEEDYKSILESLEELHDIVIKDKSSE